MRLLSVLEVFPDSITLKTARIARTNNLILNITICSGVTTQNGQIQINWTLYDTLCRSSSLKCFDKMLFYPHWIIQPRQIINKRYWINKMYPKHVLTAIARKSFICCKNNCHCHQMHFNVAATILYILIKKNEMDNSEHLNDLWDTTCIENSARVILKHLWIHFKLRFKEKWKDSFGILYNLEM